MHCSHQWECSHSDFDSELKSRKRAETQRCAVRSQSPLSSPSDRFPFRETAARAIARGSSEHSQCAARASDDEDAEDSAGGGRAHESKQKHMRCRTRDRRATSGTNTRCSSRSAAHAAPIAMIATKRTHCAAAQQSTKVYYIYMY